MTYALAINKFTIFKINNPRVNYIKSTYYIIPKIHIYQVHISKHSEQSWDPLTTLYTIHFSTCKNDEEEKVAKTRQPPTLIITVTHINSRIIDILFLKNINGLYEPQLSAYKPYL